MKAAFLKCMRYLYGNSPPSNPAQHRDLIRAFSMGWVEALEFQGNTAAMQQSLDSIKAIVHPTWWPDETWRWWSNL